MEAFYLHFDTTVAEGNILANDLQNYLSDNYNIELEKVKDRHDTQDAGAILAIVLGASSIIEIAKGIALWMQKKPEAKVTITKDKEKTEIVAEGLKSKDIEIVFKAASELNK